MQGICSWLRAVLIDMQMANLRTRKHRTEPPEARKTYVITGEKFWFACEARCLLWCVCGWPRCLPPGCRHHPARDHHGDTTHLQPDLHIGSSHVWASGAGWGALRLRGGHVGVPGETRPPNATTRRCVPPWRPASLSRHHLFAWRQFFVAWVVTAAQGSSFPA